MLMIECPWCGPDRPEVEFAYAGEGGRVRPPDPSSLSDAQWAQYLYMRRNVRGVHAERWRHVHGCGRFFNALRDTVSDRFLATWPAGQPMPEGLEREAGQ